MLLGVLEHGRSSTGSTANPAYIACPPTQNQSQSLLLLLWRVCVYCSYFPGNTFPHRPQARTSELKIPKFEKICSSTAQKKIVNPRPMCRSYGVIIIEKAVSSPVWPKSNPSKRVWVCVLCLFPVACASRLLLSWGRVPPSREPVGQPWIEPFVTTLGLSQDRLVRNHQSDTQNKANSRYACGSWENPTSRLPNSPSTHQTILTKHWWLRKHHVAYNNSPCNLIMNVKLNVRLTALSTQKKPAPLWC